MTGIELVEGTASDLSELMAVMTAAFDPRFGEAWTASQCLALMTMPGTHLILARTDVLHGFALSRTIVGECELMMLGVDPSAQRQGFGTRLLNNVVESALTEKASVVFLEVRAGNPASELYVGCGFQKVGVRSRYYRGNAGEVFDAETYRRTLR
jgi:ribosomal-protein-alanine N-acetyltransferase